MVLSPQRNEDAAILLPLKLRPPLQHGPEWTEEVEIEVAPLVWTVSASS